MTRRKVVRAALCMALLVRTVPALGYWHVSRVSYVGNLSGSWASPFSFPESYVVFSGGRTVREYGHNQSYGCQQVYYPYECDSPESFFFRKDTLRADGSIEFSNYGVFCGPPPYAWDSAFITVPMPLSAPSSQFRNVYSGVYYPYVMFHMSQKLNDCPPGNGGLFGSIGVDFSTNGFNWIQSPANPILTDGTWTYLGFPPGSSVEKGSTFWHGGYYYMMAIVATTSQGYENSISCSNIGASLTYLMRSSDAVNWTKLGLVTNSGLVAEPNATQGKWLINVNVTYDPTTNEIYMTRAYASQTTCGVHPFYQLPDRVQVYRISNGISGALGQTGSSWQLLIDIGCNTAYSFQQSLNFAPDSVAVQHNGLGYVVKTPQGGLTLILSNGNTNSCYPNAPIGIYEVEIAP